MTTPNKPATPITTTANPSTASTAPMVTLKTICAELKLEPRIAREKLRMAAREAKKYPELAKMHKPRAAWEWVKGSPEEKEARAALTAQA